VSKSFRALFCALIVFFAASAARAQLNTATALGTITDATGAAIPNATVVLTQTDTNFTRETKTNGLGEYRAEFLPVAPTH